MSSVAWLPTAFSSHYLNVSGQQSYFCEETDWLSIVYFDCTVVRVGESLVELESATVDSPENGSALRVVGTKSTGCYAYQFSNLPVHVLIKINYIGALCRSARQTSPCYISKLAVYIQYSHIHDQSFVSIHR